MRAGGEGEGRDFKVGASQRREAGAGGWDMRKGTLLG